MTSLIERDHGNDEFLHIDVADALKGGCPNMTARVAWYEEFDRARYGSYGAIMHDHSLGQPLTDDALVDHRGCFVSDGTSVLFRSNKSLRGVSVVGTDLQ